MMHDFHIYFTLGAAHRVGTLRQDTVVAQLHAASPSLDTVAREHETQKKTRDYCFPLTASVMALIMRTKDE